MHVIDCKNFANFLLFQIENKWKTKLKIICVEVIILSQSLFFILFFKLFSNGINYTLIYLAIDSTRSRVRCSLFSIFFLWKKHFLCASPIRICTSIFFFVSELILRLSTKPFYDQNIEKIMKKSFCTVRLCGIILGKRRCIATKIRQTVKSNGSIQKMNW